VNYNSVNIVALGEGVVAETGGLRGPAQGVANDRLRPRTSNRPGSRILAEACKRFALAHRQKGVCVVLSDSSSRMDSRTV